MNEKRDKDTHELTGFASNEWRDYLPPSPYADPGERWEDYMPPVTAAPRGWDKAGDM